MRLPLIAIWLLFSAPLLATAQEVAKESLAAPLDGPRFAARLVGVDPQWNISLKSDGKIRVLASEDLALWGEFRDSPTGPQVLLVDGSLIIADVLDFGTQEVTLGDSTGLGRVLWNESSIPRGQVKAVVFQPSADPQVRDQLWDKLRSAAPKEDQLLLLGGEVVAGELVAAPRSGRFVSMEKPPPPEVFKLLRPKSEQPLVIPAAKVLALLLADRTPLASPLPAHHLGLQDGSCLVARQVRVKGENVEVELRGGGVFKAFRETGDDSAPTFWDQVTLLQTASSRVSYLSDLKPLGYKHLPFVSVEFPFGVDRNVLGGRLRCGEIVATKGLGMPSASRLAYDLPADVRLLEGALGVDDQAGSRGSIVGKILVEREAGKWSTAWESPLVRAGDTPVAFAVDVKGGRRVALLVEYADHGDERDYANWLQVRLSK